MIFRSILFFFLFTIPAWALAQASPFIFHHFTEKDGLSNNVINCFLKDSRGVLWIGTFDGLNRFDGSHFYSFKRTRQTNSIINNIVHALCEDKQKNIWGSTENGFFCYDPQKNIFKNYASPNSKLASSATNIARAAYNILCDKQGNIWATGIWTILKFNESKQVFEEIGPLSPNTDSLNYYSVKKNGLIEDPSGNGLWLATGRGLHFYDFKNRQFLNYKNLADSLFTSHSVSALSRSASGLCWFFDNNTQQIICFDPVNRKIKTKIDIGVAMPNAIGATLFEDSDQRVWFSSWSIEIAMVDCRNGNVITKIKNNTSNSLSVAGDFFWCATEDEDGTLWLGTSAGISKCNSDKSMYRIHRFADKFSFLNGNSIRLIAEDPFDKSWWMITRKKLFAIHYFPVTEKYEVYDFDDAVKNQHSLPGPVYNILFAKGKVILCTRNGPWEVEGSGHRLVPYPVPKEIDPQFKIRNIAEQNGIYYYTDGKEILKYNSKDSKIISIKYPLQKLPDGQSYFLGELFPLENQSVWLPLALGWIAYINGKNEVVPVKILKNEEEEMNGFFTALNEDKQSNIWISSTGAGLYCLSPVSGAVKFWNEADGLVNNGIQSLVADSSGNIWCVAFNKFSVFTPTSGKFYNFTLPLSENNLAYENKLTLLSNGNVLACLQNNIIEFYPQRLNFKPHIRKPFIGSINIAGAEKFITEENATLELDPEEKFLSLKFGMLTDNETFPYYFEYKLDGLDDKWFSSSADNQAVYNKLPPGNYTFHLMAKARNGAWQSPETILKIHIQTPFFRSARFYALAVFLVCLLLFFFYRFRTNKQRQLHALHNKAQLLEKEKALVMYENLKQQLNPHFLFNSLTSLSSLIRLDQNMAGNFLDRMSKVYRYILKNRDNETVPLSEELKFVQMYIDLQKTRFTDALIVSVNIDEEYYHRKIVPVTLQNLVENAIKHNTAEVNSPLTIELFVENDYLVVRNNLQKKNFVETSNKQGLANMESLYRYLDDRPMEIKEDTHFFTVKIPLI